MFGLCTFKVIIDGYVLVAISLLVLWRKDKTQELDGYFFARVLKDMGNGRRNGSVWAELEFWAVRLRK